MSRPIPGVPSLQFRKDGVSTQRCSRCHRQHQQSALFVRQDPATQLQPIMVGNDLVGVLCSDCVYSVERSIQQLFPEGHAFPFVNDKGELLPAPRCELGHTLIYAADGGSMICEQCDVERVDLPGGFGNAPMEG